MKTATWTYFFVFMSTWIYAQQADSVSAMMVRYGVKLDIKESLAELAGKSDLKEFYYVFRDDIVFIKEEHYSGGDGGFFRCFDTSNKLAYNCILADDKIFAIPISYPEHGAILQTRYVDSVQIIEGYPCRHFSVMIDDAVHEVWATDIFGTQFSTIADIPGIPLYYEKTNLRDGKLKFRAVDVKPVRVPAYYFDVQNYELVADDAGSGRTVYTTPKKYDPFSYRSLDGGRISTTDTIGKVMFLTFWDPNVNNLKGDIDVLNRLKQEFEGEAVMFVALNQLRYKRAVEVLSGISFDFRHVVNASYTFKQYLIGYYPSHIIIDKKGYLRYRYNGVFGKPLLKSLKRDIESLLTPRVDEDKL